MPEQNNDSANLKNVMDMLTVANEYCLFTESAEKYELQDICLYYQRVLPLLYLKGSLLPDIEPEDDTLAGKYITEEQWEEIFNRFRIILGSRDEYFLPDQNDIIADGLLKASLSENIADIYQDMKDFILLYAKNTYHSRQNAVYLCRLLFKTRWGAVIPHALNHLHAVIYVPEEDNYETFTD
jgi:hypothetical protein